MWERFAPARVDLLHLWPAQSRDGRYARHHARGKIRYGTKHLPGGYNTMQFMSTKQLAFEHECEVRAFFNVYDPVAGQIGTSARMIVTVLCRYRNTRSMRGFTTASAEGLT
jgi:hypothetical protein